MAPVLTQGQVTRVRQVPTPPLPLAQLGAAPKQLSLTVHTSAPGPGQWQRAGVSTTPQVGSLMLISAFQLAYRCLQPDPPLRPCQVAPPSALVQPMAGKL